MTDHDPSAPPPESSGRPARRGVGGSPLGSTVSIVLAVVAVVLGFLILQNITDDDGGGGTVSVETTPSTTPGTVAPTTPPSTEPPFVTDGASVVVANASGVPGSAGRMTDELAAVGFETGTATNATSGQQEASTVHYDPTIAAAQSVADSVARVMGGLTVETVPDPVPVDGGSLDGAGVLVMLGTNEADQSLDDLQEANAPTVTAPPVAGGTTVPSTTDASG